MSKMGWKDLRPWVRGGIIGLLFAFVHPRGIYQLISNKVKLTYFFLLGELVLLLVYLIIGIGIGLAFQKKKQIKIIFLVLILIAPILFLLYSIFIGFGCVNMGGSDTCNVYEWVLNTSFPFMANGMFILLLPFIISFFLICGSIVGLIKDKGEE